MMDENFKDVKDMQLDIKYGSYMEQFIDRALRARIRLYFPGQPHWAPRPTTSAPHLPPWGPPPATSAPDLPPLGTPIHNLCTSSAPTEPLPTASAPHLPPQDPHPQPLPVSPAATARAPGADSPPGHACGCQGDPFPACGFV